MAELNDWQWAIGAAALIATLVLGGWLSRDRGEANKDSKPQVANKTITTNTAIETNDSSELIDAGKEDESALHKFYQMQTELDGLKENLEALVKEKEEAIEEAELTRLQLQQIQEELEHHFLTLRTQDNLLRQYQEQNLEFKKIISKLAFSKS